MHCIKRLQATGSLLHGYAICIYSAIWLCYMAQLQGFHVAFLELSEGLHWAFTRLLQGFHNGMQDQPQTKAHSRSLSNSLFFIGTSWLNHLETHGIACSQTASAWQTSALHWDLHLLPLLLLMLLLLLMMLMLLLLLLMLLLLLLLSSVYMHKWHDSILDNFRRICN